MKKLAIIVPYRDRSEQLEQFIPHITKELKKQNITFKILIVEQCFNKAFNRGLLCNIGFSVIQEESDYVCFHDVDMKGQCVDYSYPDTPTSLIRYRSKLENERVYDEYFGGITAFSNEDFLKVNGFSNSYWGWGCEDDDLYQRCLAIGITPDYREGACIEIDKDDDLDEVEKRNNNPNYIKNKNFLELFKSVGDVMQRKKIRFDGVNRCQTGYVLEKEERDDYFLIKVFKKGEKH